MGDVSSDHVEFLEALALRTPEILKDLHDAVMPIFTQLPQTLKTQSSTERDPRESEMEKGLIASGLFVTSGNPPLPDIATWGCLTRLNQTHPEVRPFVQALKEWAKKYDLAVEWMFDAALRTLCTWDSPVQLPQEEYLPELHFYSGEYWQYGYSTGTSPILFEHPSWEASHCDWESYRAKQVQKFEQHLEAHKRESEARQYRDKPKGSWDEAVVWTALAYVRRLSPSQILNLPESDRMPLNQAPQLEDADDSTVRKATGKVANRLGLPKLSLPPGRPRKNPEATDA